MYRFTRRDPHPPPQRKYRIQHRSAGVRERLRIHDGNGIAQIVAASQKTGSIGLELQAADRFALEHADMRSP